MSEPAIGESGQVYRAIMTPAEIHQALAGWVLARRRIQWAGRVDVQTLSMQSPTNPNIQTRVEVKLTNPTEPLYSGA